MSIHIDIVCRVLIHVGCSRIRSFNYDTALTSLTFSPDGATLYIGTENGALLVQTLRVVEPPKTVDLGDRVQCLAVTVCLSCLAVTCLLNHSRRRSSNYRETRPYGPQSDGQRLLKRLLTTYPARTSTASSNSLPR